MHVTIETNFTPIFFVHDNDLPEGVSKQTIPSKTQRDIGHEPIAIGIFYFANSVAINLFSAWLYDKIKDKPHTKIKINRKEVSIDESEITKIITEKIEIEQRS